MVGKINEIASGAWANLWHLNERNHLSNLFDIQPIVLLFCVAWLVANKALNLSISTLVYSFLNKAISFKYGLVKINEININYIISPVRTTNKRPWKGLKVNINISTRVIPLSQPAHYLLNKIRH